jgi:hypothetical protein
MHPDDQIHVERLPGKHPRDVQVRSWCGYCGLTIELGREFGNEDDLKGNVLAKLVAQECRPAALR